MSERLARELALLYTVEAKYKIAAAPIVRQLVADEQRGLPDRIPPVPRWVKFNWPASEVDRRGMRWTGEYL